MVRPAMRVCLLLMRSETWRQGVHNLPKAAAKLVTDVPYDGASRLFGALTGVGLGSEPRHTLTNHTAAGLSVLDVTPSRDEIARRITEVAPGRLRRPALVLGMDGT
jgi:hypothetical protein